MKLKKPLVVLDLETTGTWIEKDKIIEIGMIKCSPDGNQETYEKKVNPGIPIPKNVSEITGINNEDVKDAPFFKDIFREVYEFIDDYDLAGFNIERFDLPLLARELNEMGIDFEWEKRTVYDAQKIYPKHVKNR